MTFDGVQESDCTRQVGQSKGKEPRPPAKVPKCVLSGKGCGISKTARMLAQKQPYIQRVRNSSLAERSCAENVPGLKHDTEAEELIYQLVEEHSQKEEAVPKGAVDLCEERMPE